VLDDAQATIGNTHESHASRVPAAIRLETEGGSGQPYICSEHATIKIHTAFPRGEDSPETGSRPALSGDANVPGLSGPQDTYQNDYSGSYSIAMTRGKHNLKFGVDLERQQINVLFGIATRVCPRVTGDPKVALVRPN